MTTPFPHISLDVLEAAAGFDLKVGSVMMLAGLI
jgi:hypothetical protein